MDILLLGKYTFITGTIEQMLSSVDSWKVYRKYSIDNLTDDKDSASYDTIILHISDYRIPPVALITKVKSQIPKTPVLVMGRYHDKLLIEPLIEMGAAGYLQSGSPEDQLHKAIKNVAQNKRFVGTEFT